MIERLGLTSDAQLEAALRDLGEGLAVPAVAVDPARAARLRIEAQLASGPKAVGGPLSWLDGLSRRAVRRSVALAIAGVLLLAGLAVAAALGLPGIRFIFDGATPRPTPGELATPTRPAVPGTTDQVIAELRLGVPVDLTALDDLVGFHVRRPTADGLAAPAAAVRGLAHEVKQGSLVYLPTPAYPALGSAPAAIVVTQFPARLDEGFMAKLIDGGARIEPVDVGGHAGFWIAGAHEVGYLDASGAFLFDTVRLAGNVLAWNDGDITYRIEGATDLPTALALAASLR